jgi:hypothetical protein
MWAKWVRAYFKNLARKWPLTRYHAVTEWQRQGQPHLHAALWFKGETAIGSGSSLSDAAVPNDCDRPASIRQGIDIPTPQQMMELWLKISKDGGSQIYGQDVKEINLNDAGHWLQYLAKHGSRGVSNYQRHFSNVPEAWQHRTCQVWNKGGDWPIPNSLIYHGLSQRDKYQLRRVFCRFLASNPPSRRTSKDARLSTRKHWQGFLRAGAKNSRFRSPSSFITLENMVMLVKSVNSDAYFSDAVTGEVYTEVEDIPIDRSPKWKPLPFASTKTCMSDIL